MTVEEQYEEMRVRANEDMQCWDSLDWACGYPKEIVGLDQSFPKWHKLPPDIQAIFKERSVNWQKRKSAIDI